MYKTFNGFITRLKKNQIFVFGSNPEGRHGKGTAKIAKEQYGAIYGNGRGLQGKSYALITTNLRKNFIEKKTNILYKKFGKRSILKKHIILNIKELYECALKNKHLEFLIAYKAFSINLNGYSDDELVDMFVLAGIIPTNIIFEDNFFIKIQKIILKIKNKKYKIKINNNSPAYHNKEGILIKVEKKKYKFLINNKILSCSQLCFNTI